MSGGELTGQVLDDRYQVLEPVGSGAMGHVYRAERVKLGRIVAVKVMNESLQDPAARQRFEREAMAMARLEHPHCASVVDVGVHQQRPYVVMELVTGQNLKQVLEAGPLPVARAVEILRQVLSGLAHAHEHGIIHRDIKPANIVLSQKAGLGDQVKILDFGLARFHKEASNLTGGMVVGTPNYMAPEQVKGQPLDHRIDLYACGVMLFELLTGNKPFVSERNDPVEICMMHLNKPAPRMADLRPGFDHPLLEEVVARALAKDREQRFASAEEMSKALVAAAAGKPGPGPTVSATSPSELTAALPAPAPAPLTVAAPLPSPGTPVPITPPRTTTPHVIAPPPARVRDTKRGLLVAGIGAVLALGAILAVSLGGDDAPTQAAPAPTPATPPRPAPAPAPDKTEGADEVLRKAAELASSGRRDAAISALAAGRKAFPKDARIPYEAAKLYLDKMWWADGLEQARAAIALDATYRTDPALIKLVVRGFNTTKHVDSALARFLRDDIGATAKPYLEETAEGHPNPIVRKRAQAELIHYP